MVNTNFSEETTQTVFLAYEHRIEALLLHIDLLEIQLENSLKQSKL